MKILNLQTLSGPNYWSIHHHNLIVMHLDLNGLKETFTDQIPALYQGLTTALPTLATHDLSSGASGKFLQQVHEGISMGHVIEHVALELQTLAGMPVQFGHTRTTAELGTYQVVIEYQQAAAGRYAANAAVRICESIIDRGFYCPYDLEEDLDNLRTWAIGSLNGTTRAIVDAARERNIPWKILPTQLMVQLGYGVNQRRIQVMQTQDSGVSIAPQMLDIRLPSQPHDGQSRSLATSLLETLYPTPEASRIPIVAVTGTNGKTITTRLIAHLLNQTRQTVGYTTSDGTYVEDYLIEPGDSTDAQGAARVLNHPTVEIAVLETAQDGLMQSGLAFDRCDVGIVLNVTAEHSESQATYTIDEVARVKSIVAEATTEDGYVVLNADDPLVVAMANRVEAAVAFFSMNRWNPVIWEHVRRGGLAAIYEEGYVSLLTQGRVVRVEQGINIPLTLRGLAPSMLVNVMAAALAAFVQGVSVEDISTGLRTFRVVAEQPPGQMNLIQRGDFYILLDTADNPASYEALGEVVRNWSSGERVGIVGASSDRRNCDYVYLGQLAAQLFERVIVKEDNNYHNREPGEVAEWISRGIEQQNPDCDYDVILDESTAIRTAIREATPGSLIVVLPANVDRALALLDHSDQVGVP